MFIKNQKDLTKYLSTKTDIFSQKKKTPLINHNLTKVIDKTLKQMQLKGLCHAKNTFFYDEYSKSFIVFEHLLLTPKGIFVFNHINPPKVFTIESELWWKSISDNVLYPCPIHQTKIMAERLSYLLQAECNEVIPVFYYCVSNKKFTENEHLFSLKDISLEFQNCYAKLPIAISNQKLSILRTLLLEKQKSTIENKKHLYSLKYHHSFSSESEAILSNDFKQAVLFDINTFLYEFGPESVIYSNLQLPFPEIDPIDFLIVSYKGILVLNTLEGYARYEGKIDDSKWNKIIELEGQEKTSSLVKNPATTSVKQLQVLSNLFETSHLPETFRVVCQTPIQCKVKHKAIIDDKHLEHHLDRYFANTENIFDESDIQHVVKILNQLQ